MSPRLVDRTARLLSRRVDRRSFLTRSAVVGSALAAAPAAYALRPTTAYAAICSCSGSSCDCGSLCCDGYTEFCCTTTGQNSCPPGTLTGGWWKADGSAFCGGAARYYIDCNARCGSCGCGSSGICAGSCSGTPCRCAAGSCNNRKVGCTGFRYGQCHQNVPCLGPIVCRVVTCVPPWQTDSSCGTTARTDNATRTHHRPCLTGDPFGAIDSVSLAPEGLRVRGWAIDPNTTDPIRVHLHVDDAPFRSLLADVARPDLAARYTASGQAHGFDEILVLPPGVHKVCMYGINVGEGTTRPIACRTTTVPSNPFGHLDAAIDAGGAVRVQGWAIDPDTPDPVRVHIYIDGVGRRSATADRPRPDLDALYSFGPDHGFDETIDVEPGARSVCVFAINQGPGANTLLACRSVNATESPYGVLEVVEAPGPGLARVAGWAVDPSTTGTVRIHVYANGIGRLSTGAGDPRPDVADLYPEQGPLHGFDDTFATEPGTQQICVYAINQGAGGNRLLGCVEVTVP
ncbi:MAG: hypothetical protein ACT4OV_16625 [Microthrixaceae bacterium]